jgi:hypothetical protein
MKPVEVRSRLVEALELDIVGPRSGSPYEAEVLPQAPSRWYLTGFLVPYEAKVEDRQDEAGHQQFELSDGSGGVAAADDTPEPPSTRRAFFPSSVGISVLVPGDAQAIVTSVRPVNAAAIGGIADRVPPGTGAVSVFRVNDRGPKKEELAAASDAQQARLQVGALLAGYKTWISVQEEKAAALTGDRAAVARELLKQARFACSRIETGIDARSDPDV